MVLKGYKQTEEHIRKRREANLGKKLSDETKLKISLNHADISGKNNPFWKGGKYRDNSTGYILIYQPTHPRNKKGYIYQHRLVMEKFLGRYLTKEEVVHHINENTSDNRIENLMLFINRGEHIKYHNIKKKACA